MAKMRRNCLKPFFLNNKPIYLGLNGQKYQLDRQLLDQLLVDYSANIKIMKLKRYTVFLLFLMRVPYFTNR